MGYPGKGFFSYVDAVADILGVEPSTLDDVDTLAILRGVFMDNGSHSEAGAALRKHFAEIETERP